MTHAADADIALAQRTGIAASLCCEAAIEANAARRRCRAWFDPACASTGPGGGLPTHDIWGK